MHVCVPHYLLLITGLLLSSAVPGARTLTVTLDKGTVINIAKDQSVTSDCKVCTIQGRSKTCQPAVALKDAGQATVEFTCPHPEDVFTVEIRRAIECTDKSCSGNIVPKEFPSLRAFTRTFSWGVEVPVRKAFHLDLSGPGMRQVPHNQDCPDKHIYTLLAVEGTRTVRIGRFCRHGSIKGIQVLYGGKLSLEVPGNRNLDTVVFPVSLVDKIKSLAVINVSLPEAKSTQDFFSPDYPSSFPDDDLMMWEFHVPPMYYTTVRFLAYREPRCLKKQPGVEYERQGKATVVRQLGEPQPAEQQGPFTLSLRNCEMDPKQPRAPGLSLHFQVTAVKRANAAMCLMDLREEKGLSIHIAKKSGSACVLTLDSVIQEAIRVPSGRISKLSFLDCPDEDLLLSVNRTIECQQLKDCPSTEMGLSAPVLERCLSGRLWQVHWHLRGPYNASLELQSPTGSLQQDLPGQTCNRSVLFTLAESMNSPNPVGSFCPRGDIRKIQVHTANTTVTATAAGNGDFRQMSNPLLHYSFTEQIGEGFIFTVSPKKDAPVLLATPGWPAGMRSYATVSWIISLPKKMEAHLKFINVSQPTCRKRHTGIQVQVNGSREEMYSRREDESMEDVVVPGSFYLNMSNCLPETGEFMVVSHITLQKQINKVLAIILGIVGALLVLMVVVLAVVCVVIRKKKREMANNVSVYSPNVHTFPPGFLQGNQEDDDAHIYDYIEDSLVYGHLLQDEAEMKEYGGQPANGSQSIALPMEGRPLKESNGEAQVGVYQPFIGPMGGSLALPDKAVGTDDGVGSRDQHMVDNDLYSPRADRDGSAQGLTHTLDTQPAPLAEPEDEDFEIRL